MKILLKKQDSEPLQRRLHGYNTYDYQCPEVFSKSAKSVESVVSISVFRFKSPGGASQASLVGFEAGEH